MNLWGKEDRQTWFDQKEADRRFGYLQQYFDIFLKDRAENAEIEINYREDAAKVVNNIYWRYVTEHVKEYLQYGSKSTISAFKISSCTELSIVLVSPVIHQQKEKEAELNARLAFYVALSILADWHSIDHNKILKFMNGEPELTRFMEEHLKWLALLNPRYEFPVFSNSQTWRLLEYIILENH